MNQVYKGLVLTSYCTGSMTGAPKKRSVEILQALECDERGIYSGVFGYWCVSGSGDWAVTIRSCFKHDQSQPVSSGYDGASYCCPDEVAKTSDSCHAHKEEWVIGAGGAITALSDPEAEWEEMVLKLSGVLSAFGAIASQH
jgi:para-aminobenzoate synthetase